MIKRLIAILAAAFFIFSVCPVFAASESVETASARADTFWNSMIPTEKEWLKLNLSKEEFVGRAFELYSKDSRVKRIKMTENGSFKFYIGSIPCVYNYDIRLNALTENEMAGINKTETINYGTKDYHGKNVFVVAPYYGYQSSFTSYYQDLGKQLANHTGGTYTGLIGDNATGPAIRAYFASAQETVAAFFDSHGVAENGSSYLCLHNSSGLTNSDYSSGNVISEGYGYYCINGNYMTSNSSIQLNDMFLWCAICEGMMTTGIEAPFRNCGAGVVYGYSQSVSFTGDYAYAQVFWPAMMNGATVAEAAQKMKATIGNYDPYSSPRAYPVFVSDQDSYPYNPDSYQYVNSTWKLEGDPIKYYTVTFVDWDDTVLKTQTVAEGEAATAPIDPEREGYTFKGWDKAFAYVQSDLTVKALYDVNTYTVTYYVDDAQYNFDRYEYGETIIPCHEPERVGYTFSGWSIIPETMPAHDITVYGEFYINTYKVTFVDYDDTVISTVTVEYNSSADAPDAPEHEGFVFAGWDRDFSHVTSDMTVKAQYEVKVFTVRFLNWDDSVISEQKVEYGQAAVAPEDPYRDKYVFIGWDTDFSCVKADMDVKALFDEIQFTPEPPEMILGDANGDGIVNTADAAIILKYAAGIVELDEKQQASCDLNHNGMINTADATLLLKYAAGMIELV